MTQQGAPSRFEQQFKELTDRFRGYLVQKGARILMVLAAAVVGLVAIGSLAWQSLREPEAKGPAAQGARRPFLGGGNSPAGSGPAGAGQGPGGARASAGGAAEGGERGRRGAGHAR